jgi:hypothetical protein
MSSPQAAWTASRRRRSTVAAGRAAGTGGALAGGLAAPAPPLAAAPRQRRSSAVTAQHELCCCLCIRMGIQHIPGWLLCRPSAETILTGEPILFVKVSRWGHRTADSEALGSTRPGDGQAPEKGSSVVRTRRKQSIRHWRLFQAATNALTRGTVTAPSYVLSPAQPACRCRLFVTAPFTVVMFSTCAGETSMQVGQMFCNVSNTTNVGVGTRCRRAMRR